MDQGGVEARHKRTGHVTRSHADGPRTRVTKLAAKGKMASAARGEARTERVQQYAASSRSDDSGCQGETHRITLRPKKATMRARQHGGPTIHAHNPDPGPPLVTLNAPHPTTRG